MIVTSTVEFFLGIVVWILEKLPTVPPEIQAGFDDFIVRIEQLIGMIGVWGFAVPWGNVNIALGISIWGLISAIGIKIVRIVASFLTLGGGAT